MTTDGGPPGAVLPADADDRKRYTLGTHRVCTPEDTLARVQPFLAAWGVTRVGNVTGLDRTGIPVVMVTRPDARSVAVSQGKGLTLAAAKASGVMEAAELWHAEHVARPLKFLSRDEMRRGHRVSDVDHLARTGSGLTPDSPLLWIEGRDLLDGGPVWVPLEMVGADFRVPAPPGTGYFPSGTNGLASGNHPLEAICHGLCEVVERDACTLWGLSGEDRGRRLVDPLSVTDPACRRLLERFAAADVDVRIWDVTSDVGVASFCCLVTETSGEFADPEYGTGCHPAREVALLRALTEAAQVRTTFIAGARDDYPVDAWEPSARRHRARRLRRPSDGVPPAVSFTDVPTFVAPSLADDVGRLLARLRAVGIRQVIAVDLGNETFGLPVVRIVVPGLELPDEVGGGYLPGPRARRLVRSRP